MNEQLQAQITQILASIMTSVGEVKDFSVSQLPDIAQQYINYGIWSSSFYAAIYVIVLIVCFLVGRKIIALMQRDEEMLLLMAPVIVVAFFTAFALLDSIHNLILVLTAPKVWFLLELKELIS